MQVLKLPSIKALFYYCPEHAEGKPPLDVPDLPAHLETVDSGPVRADFSRFSNPLSGRDRQVKE